MDWYDGYWGDKGVEKEAPFEMCVRVRITRWNELKPKQ